MLKRSLGLLGYIDLALFQALDQIVGREVDELDRIGAVEHGVGHCLAHAHMGDLRDDVVQALDVLDVDRGVDVDAVTEQLLDVEVALGMAAARRVGVGELVDQDDLGMTHEDGVEIHLRQRPALVLDAAARNDLETFEQRFGLLAAMGFHHADDDIVTVLPPRTCLLQHLVGLADTRRGADEDLQLAGTAFLAPRRFQQGFRRRPLVRVAPLLCHR